MIVGKIRFCLNELEEMKKVVVDGGKWFCFRRTFFEFFRISGKYCVIFVRVFFLGRIWGREDILKNNVLMFRRFGF